LKLATYLVSILSRLDKSHMSRQTWLILRQQNEILSKGKKLQLLLWLWKIVID